MYLKLLLIAKESLRKNGILETETKKERAPIHFQKWKNYGQAKRYMQSHVAGLKGWMDGVH